MVSHLRAVHHANTPFHKAGPVQWVGTGRMVQVEGACDLRFHDDAGFHPRFADVLRHDGSEVSVRGDEEHKNCTRTS